LQQGRRRVANALAAAGLVETPAFPFTTQEQNDLHGSASGESLPGVRLANPLDGQTPFLRRSLLPGLLQIAHRNIARGLVDLAIFETGVVFLPEPGVVSGPRTRSSPSWTPRSRRRPASSPPCSPGTSPRASRGVRPRSTASARRSTPCA
jgi:phenylalanyl-tRNA synthetase beta subunit